MLVCYYPTIEDGEYNFDHPEAFDFELFASTLQLLRHRKAVNVPIYDFKTHQRHVENVLIEHPDVVIVSGIHVLYQKEIREIFDLRVFVDVDSDVRLAKQVIRDTEQRYNYLNSRCFLLTRGTTRNWKTFYTVISSLSSHHLKSSSCHQRRYK